MGPNRIETITTEFEAISLEAINQRASLQTRADNKYFVPWPTFANFMQTLSNSYVILEIDEQRVFNYDTQYFDTPSLTSYWGHVQGRRKRFKCRSRHYLDNGLCFFELKLKSGRGETVKYKMAYSQSEWGEVSPAAATFLQNCLRESYGIVFTQPMEPTLRTRYQRITLMAKNSMERVTCDFNLTFAGGGISKAQMAPDYVLIETKSERGRGATDQLLWRMGARPTSGSKYCLGLSLVQPELRSNPFLHTRKSFFVRDLDHQVERVSPVHVATPPVHRAPDMLTPAHAPLPSAATIVFE
jgi:hypothetical protein